MPTAHVNHPGKGTAILMNLSPQWYNAYRAAGPEAAAKRSVFMTPIHTAGVAPGITLDGGEKAFGAEITYWKQGARTIAFVVSNPEINVSSTGGGNSTGLKTDTISVTLKFAKGVAGARDERTNKELGAGRQFKFDWKMNEALVISFVAL
ncbi:MAG TPA: hypothetical protein VFC46_08560 [Humisphaera sp.]|nr:hypothetical protein [Humisphaera sp.]